MIEVNGLTYAYRESEETDEKLVLKGIDLEIKEGEFVAVLGHNGSGKSTFAKHLNAILLPAGGRVLVGGIDTRDEERLLDIRQKVGMVFQNPDNQIVATIVEEDVAFAAENLGVEPAEIRRRVDDALESVGMTRYKTYAPHLLSGGQKQRIAIAGVLAMNPKVIVFDEPTAMLDPKGRREVIATIKRLNTEHNTTVVLITHNMDEAVCADRVVVINDGEIVINDTSKKVFAHVDKMKQLGLDVPQVTALCHELRNRGFDIKEDVVDVDECVEEILKLCQ